MGDDPFFKHSVLTVGSVPGLILRCEEVLAGLLAETRVVTIQVTRLPQDSALSRILSMVRDATERKAPSELLIRKLARVYTPVVTICAVLITFIPWIVSMIHPSFQFIFDQWFYRSLIFLVISCPCALGVSIPLSYFAGIGAASRRGILFKGGNYLDAITDINTVVFDKTGTLTRGEFEIRAIHPQPDTDAETLVRQIGSLETYSSHPIAKTIVAYLRDNKIEPLPITDCSEKAGYGLRAKLGESTLLAGNLPLMDSESVEYPAQLTELDDTVVCLAVDNRFEGYLILGDRLKEDAVAAVAGLRKQQIQTVGILSGDKSALVASVARQVDADRYKGDLLPGDKLAELETLKSDPTCRFAFVGDGINDAPALAMSHVGIAMGGLGSDAAVETADIVIQTDQPSKVAEAIHIGKITRRIVISNIVFAFAVKLFVILLGVFGIATLWEAVFADVGVTLLAVLNAIRIPRLIKND